MPADSRYDPDPAALQAQVRGLLLKDRQARAGARAGCEWPSCRAAGRPARAWPARPDPCWHSRFETGCPPGRRRAPWLRPAHRSRAPGDPCRCRRWRGCSSSTPRVSMFCVSSSVWQPMRAAARAASVPGMAAADDDDIECLGKTHGRGVCERCSGTSKCSGPGGGLCRFSQISDAATHYCISIGLMRVLSRRAEGPFFCKSGVITFVITLDFAKKDARSAASGGRIRSLADTESTEDSAEQLVRTLAAKDLAQRQLRAAQFLGQQLACAWLAPAASPRLADGRRRARALPDGARARRSCPSRPCA
jgi:hypothetical protein